jgi:hypothetical protein
LRRGPPAPRAPLHFFVYYRVQGDEVAARAAVSALVAEVEARSGICGRLLARRDDPSTWMEVYEPVHDAGAFRRTLAACVRKVGAAGFAAGGVRRIECFAGLPADPVGRTATRGPI